MAVSLAGLSPVGALAVVWALVGGPPALLTSLTTLSSWTLGFLNRAAPSPLQALTYRRARWPGKDQDEAASAAIAKILAAEPYATVDMVAVPCEVNRMIAAAKKRSPGHHRGPFLSLKWSAFGEVCSIRGS